DGFKNNQPCAYQVIRAEFDELMLDHAAANGADVRKETGVERIEFDGNGARLDTRDWAGEVAEVRARFVLDCSGRNSVVANQFKLKRPYPHLNKFSVFAHFSGVQREAGLDAGLIRLVRGAYHWFWMIPVSDKLT